MRQVGTQAATISEKMAMTGQEDEKIDWEEFNQGQERCV